MIHFPISAYVRDLSRAEIIRQGLPFGYWCEFTSPFPVLSKVTGEFVIPMGFLSNGASIPNFLWAILDDTHPDILFPSYAHDYLYAMQGKLPDRILTRNQCDDVIYELMLGIGSGKVKASAVLTGLRLGGTKAWQNNASGPLILKKL